MSEIIESMLDKARSMMINRSLDIGKEIKKADKMVDTLRTEIIVYLTKIAKNTLSDQESKTQTAYLFLASELENLADVIERNVLDRIKKLVNKDLHLSEEGLSDIMKMSDIVVGHFRQFVQSLAEEDAGKALEVLKDVENSRELMNELRRKHFQRLNDGVSTSLETTEIHMDLLSHLHRINKHTNHLVQTLVEMYVS